MYPDYSYYTAITFIPTCMIPGHLVVNALFRSNIIEFYIFRILREKGIFQTTELHQISAILFMWSRYHVCYSSYFSKLPTKNNRTSQIDLTSLLALHASSRLYIAFESFFSSFFL